MYVRPKKALGQHFLNDETIAQRIVGSLQFTQPEASSAPDCAAVAGKADVLEVGPGMGVLTKYLLQRDDILLRLVELDPESVRYLIENYPQVAPRLYEDDFLKMNLSKFFTGPFYIIGNFPYNISSQIFFKVLEYRDQIPQVVGMVQKEVAQRLASPPGSKAYGILSVLLQAWYDIEYLFTVGSGVFTPPPKVESAVIRLRRNTRKSIDCDEQQFKAIIKGCFNQRRKTIRNSLRSIGIESKERDIPFLDARPEQLSVEQFIELTKAIARFS